MKTQSSAVALATLLLAPRLAGAAPRVWATDDGDKVGRDQTSLPLATGQGNPVWSPGQPVRLFALQNETVAFQIVVQADGAALDGVTVDLDALTGPATIANSAGATDPTSYVGRPIERFVEHMFDIAQPSRNDARPTESLGWSIESGPQPGLFTGWMPDALIPVEVAPSWSPYPLHVSASQNGIVWIDVTIPKGQAGGAYHGDVVVKAGTQVLATIPVELEVYAKELPDLPVKTMLYYSRGELDQRIGGGNAVEQHLWRLYHRHRLSAMHSARTTSQVTSHLAALDGSMYTAAHGYEGPGEGVGDGILSLGTYGGYGTPDAADLASVEAIADLLAQKQILASTDVFVYAIDESCSSDRGQKWKDLLATSKDANAAQVKIGWTCSSTPSKQPVDVPIVFASSFDPAAAAAARALGKDVWIYNGSRPATGAFMTDTEAVSLRVNGWIGGMYDIGRWFYWETTFWYDDNNGGKGSYDPFVTAETFHNADGDSCAGDGVLVYPGRQVDEFTTHSIGMDGVIASIRLKNFRRGIEDAGYLQLARAANAGAADGIARGLLPKVLSDAHDGSPVSWSAAGKPYFEARKALLALFASTTVVDAGAPDHGVAEAGVTVDAAVDVSVTKDAATAPDGGSGVPEAGVAKDGGVAKEGGAIADASIAIDGGGEPTGQAPDAGGAAGAGASGGADGGDAGGCSIGGRSSRHSTSSFAAVAVGSLLLRRRRRADA